MSETTHGSSHHSAHHIDVKEFHPRARAAIHNPQVRQNFRKAMDGLMTKRKSAFEGWDLETLRDLGANIRMRALASLPDLLEQLEQKLTENGITVHWATDGDEACRIVRDICVARDAKTAIKGKSMVSEEMELNHYLEEQGIEALESDLGEYIVQLAEETPSHIIMPAIHKNTGEISQLLHDKTGTDLSNDVEYLTANARLQLREKFRNADVGISGVNFAVAETGTLCLVENEGNGRMTTTVPPCHIAVTGIEKVVPNLEDVTALLALLTRSATGQHITTYFNMISSPRKPNSPTKGSANAATSGTCVIGRPISNDSTISCFDFNDYLEPSQKMKSAYDYGEDSPYYDPQNGLRNFTKQFADRLRSHGDRILRGDLSILPEMEKIIKRRAEELRAT
jgi:L-lactate dehydrogenase complex protein LldF